MFQTPPYCQLLNLYFENLEAELSSSRPVAAARTRRRIESFKSTTRLADVAATLTRRYLNVLSHISAATPPAGSAAAAPSKTRQPAGMSDARRPEIDDAIKADNAAAPAAPRAALSRNGSTRTSRLVVLHCLSALLDVLLPSFHCQSDAT